MPFFCKDTTILLNHKMFYLFFTYSFVYISFLVITTVKFVDEFNQ